MRFFRRLAAATALLLASSNAYASTAQPGYISQIFAMANGVVMFSSSGARSTPPGCQSAGVSQRWAIDATTPAGQAKVAALLTAYSLRKQIQIVGTGACPNWSDTETLDYFFTINDG